MDEYEPCDVCGRGIAWCVCKRTRLAIVPAPASANTMVRCIMCGTVYGPNEDHWLRDCMEVLARRRAAGGR